MQVVNIGIILDFLYGLLAGAVLLFVLRPYWGAMFTIDPAVKDMVFASMPIMFLYLFVDATKCVTLTILRSTGRPTITVYGNAFACLVIMLPLGWELALRQGQGLVGLWLAMSVAWMVMTVVYLAIVMRTDWRTQIIAKKGQNGQNEENGHNEEEKSGMMTSTITDSRSPIRRDHNHTTTNTNTSGDVEMAIRI